MWGGGTETESKVSGPGLTVLRDPETTRSLLVETGVVSGEWLRSGPKRVKRERDGREGLTTQNDPSVFLRLSLFWFFFDTIWIVLKLYGTENKEELRSVPGLANLFRLLTYSSNTIRKKES